MVVPIKTEAFAGFEVIRDGMDAYIRMLKNSPKAHGQERIYVAGRKEFEADERNRLQLTIQTKVYDTLEKIATIMECRSQFGWNKSRRSQGI